MEHCTDGKSPHTERQLAECTPGGHTSSVTREPAHHSSLTRSESISEENRPAAAGATAASAAGTGLPLRETQKDE